MTAGTPVRRRPRDRRERIVAAAVQRFRLLGYHGVSMAEIAADVDIGASALYRHFRGKQDLLLTVLDQELALREQAVAAGPAVAALAALAPEHRDFGALWQREAGHLPAEPHRALRHRMRGLAGVIAAELAAGDTADLRSWAVLSVLDSPAHHHVQPEPARLVELLVRASAAVAEAPLPPAPAAAPPAGAGLQPASRREALLVAATRLFAARGFPSVGLDDIGTAAGIAGPSVYNHFASKTDVLVAALTRGNEALWLGLHHILAAAVDRAAALDGLAAHYAGFAAADPDLMSVLVAETVHLPDERRTAFRRAQRDYVTEWLTLLRGVRPELDDADARILVHASLALVNSLARIPHLVDRPGHPARVAALAQAVLRA